MNTLNTIVNILLTITGSLFVLVLLLVPVCWLFICLQYDKMFKHKFKFFRSWLVWGNPLVRSVAYSSRIVFRKLGSNGTFNKYLFQGYNLRKDANTLQIILSYLFIYSMFTMLAFTILFGVFAGLYKILQIL